MARLLERRTDLRYQTPFIFCVPGVVSWSGRVPGGLFDLLYDLFRLTVGLEAISLTLGLTIQTVATTLSVKPPITDYSPRSQLSSLRYRNLRLRLCPDLVLW